MGIRRLGGGGVDGDMASSPELFPPVSCPVGAAELGAKSAPAPRWLEVTALPLVPVPNVTDPKRAFRLQPQQPSNLVSAASVL